MNADTVGMHVVTQGISDDDALAAWMDGGQTNDASDCAGFGQFRVVKVLPLAFEHRFTYLYQLLQKAKTCCHNR